MTGFFFFNGENVVLQRTTKSEWEKFFQKKYQVYLTIYMYNFSLYLPTTEKEHGH